MSDSLRIVNGRVFDPSQGWAGEVRSVLIHQGRIVEEQPSSTDPLSQTGGEIPSIDASGCVVMAGGVEMHAHVASNTVNAARAIQAATGYPGPDAQPVVPNALATGRLFAQMGYTTAVEPAVPPAAAASAHAQLDATPHLDAGLLLLLGNHEALLERIQQGDSAGAIAVAQEALRSTAALGIKAVNPSAGAAWRRGAQRPMPQSPDQAVPGMDKVSTLSVLKTLCQAQQALGLAHPVHVHGPRLGEPGNVGITAEMIRALAGWPLHLAHLQYYCYGQDEHGRHRSDVASLVGTLSDLPSVTADLGLVAFGPAFTATADQPLEFGLVRHVGTPSTPAVFCDHENEDGFGIMPLKHKPNVAEHAIQWATGLELALSWDDPWRYALTVDHPNGGSFLNYPGLIALLMSRPRREEALAGVHRAARDRTGLGAIQREMTLSEIATITRAAPARALGMSDRGHLRPGARGDVAIYEDRPDEPEAMFSRAKHVIKAGRFIVRDGVCLDDTPGERLRERLEPSDQGAALLRDWAGRFGSFAPGQLVAGC